MVNAEAGLWLVDLIKLINLIAFGTFEEMWDTLCHVQIHVFLAILQNNNSFWWRHPIVM